MSNQHKSKMRAHTVEPVRNLKAFLNSYLQSEAGRSALRRGPRREKWGNSALAVAFQKAVA